MENTGLLTQIGAANCEGHKIQHCYLGIFRQIIPDRFAAPNDNKKRPASFWPTGRYK